MIDDKPYKIVWKKTYERYGEHVHYEQYLSIENAESRMDELINTHQVSRRDITLHCRDMQLWNPLLHQQ